MGTQLPIAKKVAKPPPQISAHVCCCQTAGWIKMAFGMEVGLGSGHIVLDGDPAHFLQKACSGPSIIDPFLLWPNGWMHQDATWYGGRFQPRRFCVRWGPSPLPKPKSILWPQRDAWIKMPLGTEVGLGLDLRDIVLNGDPAPAPLKRHRPPIFGQYSLWPNRLIDTWYGGRPRPRRLCVRWGPSYPQKKSTPTKHTHLHPIFDLCRLWQSGWMDQDAN